MPGLVRRSGGAAGVAPGFCLPALLLAACTSVVGGLWNDCSMAEVMDLSAVPGLEDFWESFVRTESALNIDTGADMTTGRFFSRWASVLTKSDGIFSETVRNCVFGILTVLLQALPFVDYDRGRGEALKMLDLARHVAEEVSNAEGYDDVASEAKALGWEVESIYSTLEGYTSILAMSEMDTPQPSADSGGTEGRADCQGLSFYVYPPPTATPGSRGESGEAAPHAQKRVAKLLRAGSHNYLDALLEAPLQCLFGMYGTEFLFHHFFATSNCRVSTPADADFFFVPSYFKCIEVINYADHFNEERPDEDEAALLFEQTVSYVRSAGAWYERHDGSDHIFLFSWGRFPCRLPGWRAALRSSIALQVEDHCEDFNYEPAQPTFSRWKDIIIPGHIDRWRAVELRRWNKPSRERDVLMSFHGRHAENADSYANVTVRTRIMELASFPGVSVGGFIDDYHELLGSSIYCLAPRGITPWTIHLYVALLAGCIPVILSNEFELPFQDILDWPSFSIRWPEERVGKDLLNHLMSIPVDTMFEMKRQVDEHACWFDYYSDRKDCSPFVAVLQALKRRREQRPRFAGRWWGVPSGIAA